MNNDLISRKDLKNFINKVYFSEEWMKYRVDYGSRGQIECILSYIDNAPTVAKIDTNDLEYKAYCDGLEDGKKLTEPWQGRWIRYRDDPHQPEHIKCSICGQYWSIAEHDKIFNYCFKCGADMRGKEE